MQASFKNHLINSGYYHGSQPTPNGQVLKDVLSNFLAIMHNPDLFDLAPGDNLSEPAILAKLIASEGNTGTAADSVLSGTGTRRAERAARSALSPSPQSQPSVPAAPRSFKLKIINRN